MRDGATRRLDTHRRRARCRGVVGDGAPGGGARAGGLPGPAHTSAGRIPTDKGYRFFVDHLAAPGRLDAATSAEVGAFFSAAHGRLEEMLLRTSNLLSHLTSYAAVVVGPKTEAATVRSIQLVGLSNQRATVVVVLGNGTVENQIVELPAETTDATVDAASAHLARARWFDDGVGRDRPERRHGRRRRVQQRVRGDPAGLGRRPRLRRRRVVDGRAFDAVESFATSCTRSSNSSSSCRSCATSSIAGCRWRSGSSTASSRFRPARWSWRRSWSVASISARSASPDPHELSPGPRHGRRGVRALGRRLEEG